MPNPTQPDWLTKLGDAVSRALDEAEVDQHPDRAAIFIAAEVHQPETDAELKEGYSHVTHDVRGLDHALAEAAGRLVYYRHLPEVIHRAAFNALCLRGKEEALEASGYVEEPDHKIINPADDTEATKQIEQ